MNIPVVLLSKSTLTVFSHTSFNILKVLLTSLCLFPSFAVLSRAPTYALLCYVSPSMGYITFLSSLFGHLYYFSSSNFLLEITLCPMFFFPYNILASYTSHILSIILLYHPNSSRHTLSGMPSSQCSCTFHYKIYTRLLLYPFCCASCSLVICTALSSPYLLFSFFLRGHSLHFSSHLKHSTTTSSCLLNILSSIPHYITLLVNISNLF